MIRQDKAGGYLVLLARERANRPHDYTPPLHLPLPPAYSQGCPFCPGYEAQTPGSSVVVENPSGGWQVRIVPNKYPAVESNQKEPLEPSPFYNCYAGVGVHDVVVDTPIHNLPLHKQTAEHIAVVFQALQQRYIQITENSLVEYIQIFKNAGKAAGASKVHSHWQIIGADVVPPLQGVIFQSLAKYYHKVDRCLYCDMIKLEKAAGARFIMESRYFTVFCPYAPRFSYETWIFPKRHFHSLGQLSGNEIKDLSVVFKKVLGAVLTLGRSEDYNLCLMDGKTRKDTVRGHWHVQIIPRNGSLAGYEFSTGSYINALFPEEAAEKLRGLLTH